MYRRYTSSENGGAAAGSQDAARPSAQPESPARNKSAAKGAPRKSPSGQSKSGNGRSGQSQTGSRGKSSNPRGSQTGSRGNTDRAREEERREYDRREHEREHAYERGFPPPPRNERKDGERKKNPILGFIPASVYNPETKKVFGFLKAEDLLLIALILMFLDNEDNDDPWLLYALIFILISDWIDLSAIGNILPF